MQGARVSPWSGTKIPHETWPEKKTKCTHKQELMAKNYLEKEECQVNKTNFFFNAKEQHRNEKLGKINTVYF